MVIVAAILAFGLLFRSSSILENILVDDRPMITTSNSASTSSSGGVSFDVGEVCRSKTMNTPGDANADEDHHHQLLPYSELMELGEVRSVLRYWYEFNCQKGMGEVQKGSCSFASIGQHLLYHAIQLNQTLLTVQVGAMDGKSNDPMYEMFVADSAQQHVRAMESSPFSNLRNWLPVLIEPVPANYEALVKTYMEISKTKGLACAVPINAVVSYDHSHDEDDSSSNQQKTTRTTTTCPFCRVNTAKGAPKECTTIPDWAKFQIGTLDCAHSRKFFGKDFDLCILQDPLPCSSITNLLLQQSLSSDNIAILQIDIEGYEYRVFEGLFLGELPEYSLPPVIHFEHKVMKEQDEARLTMVKKLIQSKGYELHQQGEDYLAVRMGGGATSGDAGHL